VAYARYFVFEFLQIYNKISVVTLHWPFFPLKKYISFTTENLSEYIQVQQLQVENLGIIIRVTCNRLKVIRRIRVFHINDV
jgi:hypothetical protein